MSAVDDIDFSEGDRTVILELTGSPSLNAVIDIMGDSAHGSASVLTPLYTNPGGSGDRTGTCTITTSEPLINGDLGSNLIDGNMLTSGAYFTAGSTSGAWIEIDFGSAQVITESTWYQDAGYSQGIWQFQGSNDNSSWTSIGGTFDLGNSLATCIITTLSANTTRYRYYRILGISGTPTSGPWLYEWTFKLDGTPISGVGTTLILEIAAGGLSAPTDVCNNKMQIVEVKRSDCFAS